MKKIVIILGILFCFPLFVNGQNDIQLSQQMFSRMNYNPAATGATNYIQAFLLSRDQWSGFGDERPRTQVFSAQNYFESLKSGIGLSVVYDQLGFERNFNAKVNYGYHLFLNEEAYFSLGLGLGVLNKTIKGGLNFEDPNDPNGFYEKKSKFSPDVDFGIEFNMKKFQVGASMTHITQKVDADILSSTRHGYVYSKYTFELGDYKWNLIPQVMFHGNRNLYQFEGNLMLRYVDRFWVGCSFRALNGVRSETAVIPMAGVHIFDFLMLGYSYDLNLGKISSYSSGSHEIMLSVRLSKDDGYSRKTPRFFE